MKFQLNHDPLGRISFNGEFTEHELVDLKLDRLDMALLHEIGADPNATAADHLLALELIYRRHQELHAPKKGPILELTVVDKADGEIH